MSRYSVRTQGLFIFKLEQVALFYQKQNKQKN